MEAVFSRRTVILLILVGTISFVGSLIPILTSDGTDKKDTWGANSYSLSAIGHNAFFRWLAASDYTVFRNRLTVARDDRAAQFWIFLEPDPEYFGERSLKLPSGRSQILIVLPKWRGVQDTENPEWLGSASLVPSSTLRRLLSVLELPGKFNRIDETLEWQSGISGFPSQLSLKNPQLLPLNTGSPLIWSDRGALLTLHRTSSRSVWILSDPDIVNNHGINNGDNIQLVARIIDYLHPYVGSIIVDETHHGYRLDPNLLKTLLNIPFVSATLASAAALTVFLWASATRFGRPLPWQPRSHRGNKTLIDNAAELLASGGHLGDILNDFAAVQVRQVLEALHAPPGMSAEQANDWADRVAKVRGVDSSIRDLRLKLIAVGGGRHVDRFKALRLARRIELWKREMLNG